MERRSIGLWPGCLSPACLSLGIAVCLLSSTTAAARADDTDSYAALIMGGTTQPTPSSTYVDDVVTNYILPRAGSAEVAPTALTTPEQLWPLPGFSEATFGQSVTDGLAALQDAIDKVPAGTDTIVFGFSQSSTVATAELNALANGTVTNPPDPSDLSFILAGNPNNPDGGLLERLEGLYLPGINFPFSGPTPSLDYPTDIYTVQYDGAADFPQYPLNILSDLNALLGIFYVHDYTDLTPEQVASAIVEPVSPGAVGDTTYYFIPTQTLPLLEPLAQAGAPQWLIDLINPDLRVLVDLGYGNIGGVINPDFADLPTPGNFFELVNPFTVVGDLIQGTGQGIAAALVDVGALPESFMPDAYPFIPSLAPELSINLGQPGETLLSALTGLVGSALQDLNIPDAVTGMPAAADFFTDAVASGAFDLGGLF